MTEVAAALIFKGDRFLICQRPADKKRGLLWEFVGGKAEKGETLRQAVTRECKEELGIEISAGEEFMNVFHSYPDIDIHLTVFLCGIEKGEIQLLEHNDARWITPEEMPLYRFCPADTPILEKIKNIYGK